MYQASTDVFPNVNVCHFKIEYLLGYFNKWKEIEPDIL